MPQSNKIFNKQFLERRLSSLSPKKPICVLPSDTTGYAVSILQQNKTGSVLVCSDDGKIRGIFTERDVVTKLSKDFNAFKEIAVEEVMTANPITVKHFSTVSRALFLMNDHGFRHLPLEGADGSPTGVLSSKDLVDYLHVHVAKRVLDNRDLADDYHPNEVENFMGSSIDCLKPRPALIAEETLSVREVMTLMRESRVGCVPIGREEKIYGIFTERDYLLKVLLKEPSLEDRPVSLVMTGDPHTLLLSNSVSMVFNSLSGGGFRHLPIVDGTEKLVGIISVKDILGAVLRGIIDELQSREK
jgi:CBS domain-containing protein